MVGIKPWTWGLHEAEEYQPIWAVEGKNVIDLYFWPTQNCRKISIALEELELPYNIVKIDIQKKEQFSPEFLALNPLHKVPVIIDNRGTCGPIFESGAILMYLAEKTGLLLPNDQQSRYRTISWLLMQVSLVGPVFGQRNHFAYAKQYIEYAVEKYTSETSEILDLLDGRLEEKEFLSGEYSIADIATFPWIHSNAARHDPSQFDGRPHLQRWFRTVGSRPAVKRGMELLADMSWDRGGLDKFPLG